MIKASLLNGNINNFFDFLNPIFFWGKRLNGRGISWAAYEAKEIYFIALLLDNGTNTCLLMRFQDSDYLLFSITFLLHIVHYRKRFFGKLIYIWKIEMKSRLVKKVNFFFFSEQYIGLDFGWREWYNNIVEDHREHLLWTRQFKPVFGNFYYQKRGRTFMKLKTI